MSDITATVAGSATCRPTLAVVSGRPGSGKTTLARRLSAMLSCPMISRDEINDGIVRTHALSSTPPSKDEIARITYDAFFRLIELLIRCEATVVAEAAFQDPKWRLGLEPLLPIADVRLIHCVIDGQLAYERVLRRRADQTHVIRLDARKTSSVSPTRPFVPPTLPVPELRVETASDYVPGLDSILEFLTSR